jgi:exocyst complex component 4
MDLKSSDLATEKEDLEFMLKTSVPGLISDSKTTVGMAANDSNVIHDGSATGHKLLVEPSVFNMGLLLPPSLDFLQRLRGIVPPNSDIVMSTLTSFLDDFLVNVFHPQLDETLVEFCAQTFIEVDAFQEDSKWALHSQKPIFKGTIRFFTLITAFCKMLDRLPHDQSISELIITQMGTYYNRCFGWYKALITRGQVRTQNGSRLKESAKIAEGGELHDLATTLLQASTAAERHGLMEQEIIKLIAKTGEQEMEEGDLIAERKSIVGLALLYTSMKWLASKVQNLRYISDRAMHSSRRDGSKPKINRWTLISSPDPAADGKPVYLPLNHETAT